jgi:hypothetical protein
MPRTSSSLSANDQQFTFSLLTNVQRHLDHAIERGCYLKKALLAALLNEEIHRLETALPEPCDPAVARHVRAQQNHAALKNSWHQQQVSLPVELAERIESICRKKNVVRDAFINRAVFLATAPFAELSTWFELAELSQLEYFSDAQIARIEESWGFESATRRLTGDFDPLHVLHDALDSSPAYSKAGPSYLYTYKVFEGRPALKNNPPTKADTKNDATSAALRREWAKPIFAWCITCWAEPSDLKDDNLTLADVL